MVKPRNIIEPFVLDVIMIYPPFIKDTKRLSEDNEKMMLKCCF